MWELAYEIDVDVLEDEAVARPLVEAITGLPGIEPTRYDMNRRRQWRDFTVDHAVVDMLTQRTQLVEFDVSGQQTVMVTTGTRGEPPTLVARLEAIDDASAVEFWDALASDVLLAAATLTTAQWRQTLGDLGWEADHTPTPPAAVCAWPAGAVPEQLEVSIEALDDPGPIRLERCGRLHVLWLAPDAEIEGPEHRQALEALAAGQ